MLNFSQRRALWLVAAVLPLTGCAFRLPPATPPFQQLIHVVANTPEQYAVEVHTGTVRKYDVPADGRIKGRSVLSPPLRGLLVRCHPSGRVR
jgi:hypothetical protein